MYLMSIGLVANKGRTKMQRTIMYSNYHQKKKKKKRKNALS